MPSAYDLVPALSPAQQETMRDLIASAEPEPSPYVCVLAQAYLLAPENAVEEDVLRALFLQHARAEGIDGDALLEAASAWLRAEGLLT